MHNAQWKFDGVWLMKASQEEKDAATASTNLSNTITNNMNSTFAKSQNIQGSLNAQLQDLTNKGLAGQGFGVGEEAALRTDSTERAAQQTVQAEQANNQRVAGQGGPVTSGSVGANDAAIASASAANNANTQRAITLQNSALARENLTSGLTGLGSLSNEETSQTGGLTSPAVSGAGQSFNEETQAHQPSNFWSGLATSALGMGLNAIAPGVGTLASGVLGGLTKGSGPSNDDGYNGG